MTRRTRAAEPDLGSDLTSLTSITSAGRLLQRTASQQETGPLSSSLGVITLSLRRGRDPDPNQRSTTQSRRHCYICA